MGNSEFIVSRCPRCSSMVELEEGRVRSQSLDGKLLARCPICSEGEMEYLVEPPLTIDKIIANALEV